nr:MAG TPA: hypothetical protein [Caudoviricetes sp.]
MDIIDHKYIIFSYEQFALSDINFLLCLNFI